MAWIIQFLPTLISLIPQILALIKAIQNALSHQAAVASGLASASDVQWWLYVPGQALAGTVVTGLLILLLQPKANAMGRAYRSQCSLEAAAVKELVARRNQLGVAYQLRAEVSALSPEHQEIVKR